MTSGTNYYIFIDNKGATYNVGTASVTYPYTSLILILYQDKWKHRYINNCIRMSSVQSLLAQHQAR